MAAADNHKETQTGARVALKARLRSGGWIEASPPMDLWIMGLLYKLIVGGSGDAWRIERKGIRAISVSHQWNVWQPSSGGPDCTRGCGSDR